MNYVLLNSKLSLKFWDEALYRLCHIHNKVLSRRFTVSPYELWNNTKKPNINYLKVRGCIAFYKMPGSCKNKLGPRGFKYFFIGYAQSSKTKM